MATAAAGVPISAYPARIELLTQHAQAGALVAAVVLVIALYAAWRASAAFGVQRKVSLHQDDSAIASIEFLLVLLPLMSIVLVVIQLALMLNAQMNVAYSAYTAARSASTVAYMDLGGAETEGQLSIGGQKWQKINRAAMPGVIAISPGSLDAAGLAFTSAEIDRTQNSGFNPPLPGLSDVAAAASQVTLMSAHRDSAIVGSTGRLTRAGVKVAYARVATDVKINGSNREQALSLGGAETLNVTVEYNFWMNIPYAGGALKAVIDNSNFQLSSAVGYPTLKITESVAVTAWPKRKAF